MDEVIRNVMNGFCRRLFGTRAATHATLIVALNRDVEVRWGQGRRPVVVESNTALETAELTAGDDIGESEFAHERTALFVGRLIPWKGLLLAVESLRLSLIHIWLGPSSGASTQHPITFDNDRRRTLEAMRAHIRSGTTAP